MPSSIYEKATQIIAERKERRKRELDRRRGEVFAIVPRIREIEEELDRFGIRMLNLIANGECDEKTAVSSITAQNKEFIKERERLLSEAGFDKTISSFSTSALSVRTAVLTVGSFAVVFSRKLRQLP